MKKMMTAFILGIVSLSVPIDAHAMTFQFDRTKPGVTELVASYVKFSIHGKLLAEILPPVFYLVTESSEKDTVVIAKVQSPQDKALWIFLAGSSDALVKFLKGAATPQATVTPDQVFLSDGLPKAACAPCAGEIMKFYGEVEG